MQSIHVLWYGFQGEGWKREDQGGSLERYNKKSPFLKHATEVLFQAIIIYV